MIVWPLAARHFRVIADDVVLQAAGRQTWRDADVVLRGELDGFLAADDRHPDFRMRMLHRARPQRDVAIRPVFALVGEDVLGPGAGDDLVGFLEARARFRECDIVHLVFARNAAGKPGDQPPVGQAVEHRQFFRQAQRLVQRQQVAVDQQSYPLGALCGGGRHQVGRVHQAVRRAMVLVEAETVVAESIDFLPGIEVLGIGAHRHIGPEVPRGQRIRQLVADLQVVQMFAVGEQVKDEDLHGSACVVEFRRVW